MRGRWLVICALAGLLVIAAPASGRILVGQGSRGGDRTSARESYARAYLGTTSQGQQFSIGFSFGPKIEVDAEVYVPGTLWTCTNPNDPSHRAGLTLLFFVSAIGANGFSLHSSSVGETKDLTGQISGNQITGSYHANTTDVGGSCDTGRVTYTARAPAGSAVAGNGTSGGGNGTSGGSGSKTPGSGSVRCIVPKLAGSALAVATKLLAQAHCKLGTVTEPKPKTGTTLVASTSPTAGTSLPSGTKVNLKLRDA